MMALLARLRIGVRLFIGFGLVIAALGATAYFSVGGLDTALKSFTSYRELARDTNLSARIQGNLLTARIAVVKFNDTGDADVIATVRERLAATRGYVDTALDAIQKPERAAGIREIDGALTGYKAGFEELVELRRAQEPRIDKLNELGPSLSENLKEIMESARRDNDLEAAYRAGRALGLLGEARFHGQAFLRTKSADWATAAIEDLDQLSSEMGDLLAVLENPRRRTLAEAATESAGVYRETVSQLQQIVERGAQIYNEELGVIGPRIATVIEDVKLSVKAEQDTLGPVAVATVEAAGQRARAISIAATVAGVVIAVVLMMSVTGPVNAIRAAMLRLADGERLERIPGVDNRDEIGDMARAMSSFRDKMAASDKALAEQLHKISDLLMGVLNTRVGQTTEATKALIASADRLAGNTGTLRAKLDDTNRASGTANEAVQGVAAAVQQLNASIETVSRRVDETVAAAETSVSATAGNLDHIKRLDLAAESIGGIVKTITDIANQTNLLALNATIEAARAGEQGRGFAVVAGEVKGLAAQTTRATDDVAKQIGEVQALVRSTSQGAEEIGGSINSMLENVRAVGEIMSQQLEAVREIGSSAEVASDGTATASSNVVEVNAISVDSANLADEGRTAATQLKTSVESLATELSDIIENAAMSDRRRDKRYATNQTATLSADGTERSIEIADLSTGGAAFKTPIPLPKSRDMTLTIDGVAIPCRAVDATGNQMARVAFQVTRHAVREAIRDLVARRAA